MKSNKRLISLLVLVAGFGLVLVAGTGRAGERRAIRMQPTHQLNCPRLLLLNVMMILPKDGFMSAYRCSTIIALLFAVSLLCAACATPTASPTSRSAMPTGPDAVWHLIVIGDSSLWGLTRAFAAQIEKDVGVSVVEENFVVGGLSAGAVLQALETGESPEPKLKELPAALSDAEVVVMFVNPLDSVDPEKPLDFGGCFGFKPPASCPPESFEKYTADIQAIWAAIIEARAGQPTILRATDIYNPLVSRWQKYDQFQACDACWVNMSNAARLAAEAYDIPFLSRYDAFNGASHIEDPREKGYIISDGEHPSELASEYTAELLSQMGYEPVVGP